MFRGRANGSVFRSRIHQPTTYLATYLPTGAWSISWDLSFPTPLALFCPRARNLSGNQSEYAARAGTREFSPEGTKRIATRNCDFPQCACISFNKLRAEIYWECEARLIDERSDAYSSMNGALKTNGEARTRRVLSRLRVDVPLMHCTCHSVVSTRL